MNKLLFILTIIVIICAWGCTAATYDPETGRISITSVGNDKTIQGFKYHRSATTRSVEIEGYQSDSSRAWSVAEKLADKVP